MSITIINRQPFADLFRDKVDLGKVTRSFVKTIGDSFVDPNTTTRMAPTVDEMKRRFAICEKWFRDMRGERKWSIDRCLAAIPHALRAELNGTSYEPDNRSLWSPADGAP